MKGFCSFLVLGDIVREGILFIFSLGGNVNDGILFIFNLDDTFHEGILFIFSLVDLKYALFETFWTCAWKSMRLFQQVHKQYALFVDL